MKEIIGYDLKEGNKFKIKGGEVTWTVIETNPVQYEHSFRAKGQKITAPFTKNQIYYKID